MIGQTNILHRLKRDYINNDIPRFALFVGAEGSGKATLAKTVAKDAFNGNVIFVENRAPKIDEIRGVIESAYKVSEPTLIIILDVDRMSNAAKNSVLKVIEEPPKNVSFIMTACDTQCVLPTILSRARKYTLDNYSSRELFEYLESLKLDIDKTTMVKLIHSCNTPGDINKLIKQAGDDVDGYITAFYEYVETVMNNVALVSGANALKIGSKINLKDDDDKYDLKLFLNTFSKLCNEAWQVDFENKYIDGDIITHRALQRLNNAAFNKQMIFDMWVLELRQEWI